MPISVKWLVPNSVIYVVFEGEITSDLAQYDEALIKLSDSSTQPLVHMIADIQRIATLPSLPQSMQMKYLRHPRFGWTISVGITDSPVLLMFASIVASVAKLRTRHASTMDEALRVLQDRVPDLPDLQQAWAALHEEQME